MTFDAFRQRVLDSALPDSIKGELIESFKKEWVTTDQRLQDTIVWAQNQAKEQLLSSYARHVMQLQALSREQIKAAQPTPMVQEKRAYRRRLA